MRRMAMPTRPLRSAMGNLAALRGSKAKARKDFIAHRVRIVAVGRDVFKPGAAFGQLKIHGLLHGTERNTRSQRVHRKKFAALLSTFHAFFPNGSLQAPGCSMDQKIRTACPLM